MMQALTTQASAAQTLTLGVIGHVDHGKTALVRALTGIETDRLKEERERGLSIVLGFSYLETPHCIVDLIDVPGHEDFIRAMISGATGLDGVVLLVAANEGVMPQTREHFDIARLLDLRRGVIVVNKVDVISTEALHAVIEDVRAFVRGSFLETAPIIAASALNGQGVDTLRSALTDLATLPVERPAAQGFYLPLDRVFIVHGFGLVATGTLRGGVLGIDERMQIIPGGRSATVRALQSRNQPIDAAHPGQRVPGFLTSTRRIDAELSLLENQTPIQKGIKNGASVRLLLGTTEAIARISLLDQQNMSPGSTAMVQLQCDRDIATHASERFVIRSYSPMTTIGGGRVLDANPVRHRRFDESVVRRLETTAAGDPAEMLQQLLAEARADGIDIAAAAERLALTTDGLRALTGAAEAIEVNERRVVEKASYLELLERIVAEIEQHHRTAPHRRGVAAGRVKTRISPQPHDEVFRRAIGDLVTSARIRNDVDTPPAPEAVD